ncbi:MAG: hypothetical protein J07HX64_01126 [halophilic archaeon J07HX64]|nr:MAG: hypothetical protein J07HX64_01126 [halophilic archaeon J07HX64]
MGLTALRPARRWCRSARSNNSATRACGRTGHTQVVSGGRRYPSGLFRGAENGDMMTVTGGSQTDRDTLRSGGNG